MAATIDVEVNRMIEKMILEQVEILREHLLRGDVTPEFVQNRAQMIYMLSLSVEAASPPVAQAAAVPA